MLAFFALAVTLALPLHGSGNAPAPVAQYFDPAFKGCFELLNLDEGRRLRSDPGNCAARVSPASTFKIPHALIALENGIVADETTPLRWNGTQYPIADWNRDQTLGSAIRGSVVWYFQRIADQLGTAREQLWLDRLDYGNRDAGGGLEQFWLGSSLKISPDEQIDFLANLYRDRLPFERRNMAIVKRILVQPESSDGVTLSGKTGSAVLADKTHVGWFVGALRGPQGHYVFALDYRGPERSDPPGFVARNITLRILRDAGLLADG